MATLDQIRKLLQAGQAKKAVVLLKPASRRRPNDTPLLSLLAEAYRANADYGFALAAYDRLARLSPKHPKPLADKALLLQQLGRMEEANQALNAALELAPLNGSLLRMLSVTDRLRPETPHVARMQAAWDSGALPRSERIEAGYALFKALGRDGFPYLEEANRLQREAHPWTADSLHQGIASLKAALSAGPWPEAPSAHRTTRPIFVTGMPRSGTTLVEQILSCHPAVTATGETGLPTRAAYSVLHGKDGFRPMSGLTSADLELIATRYLDGMAHFHKVGPVFADKSIQTFMVLGLFHHILPEARCIVVRRDPRDVGWSIYRNFFETGGHGYSNDQVDIARYAQSVEDMLAYWREMRPEAFIEIRYEDLVSKPEPEVRRLLSYCGLDWDPACLAPEKSTRSVATLSVDQVRAPISPASVGGWRRWATELQPMIEEMKDLAAAWD